MMTFKLDTGAEVTALTEPAFHQLKDATYKRQPRPSMAQTGSP